MRERVRASSMKPAALTQSCDAKSRHSSNISREPKVSSSPPCRPALGEAPRTGRLTGRLLGSYEVQSLIAAGGMGEVYRAVDTRLHRAVAIKVLPEHLSDHPERRERFKREAMLISSLNHPHICSLFHVGTHEGLDYLVMELIDGETLQARLARRPMRCG